MIRPIPKETYGPTVFLRPLDQEVYCYYNFNVILVYNSDHGISIVDIQSKRCAHDRCIILSHHQKGRHEDFFGTSYNTREIRPDLSFIINIIKVIENRWKLYKSSNIESFTKNIRRTRP